MANNEGGIGRRERTPSCSSPLTRRAGLPQSRSIRQDRAPRALKTNVIATQQLHWLSESRSPPIRTIVGYINSNLDRRLTLNDLGTISQILAHGMCYLFKEEIGMPLPDSMSKLSRMQKAAELFGNHLLTVRADKSQDRIAGRESFRRAFRRCMPGAAHYRARRTLF